MTAADVMPDAFTTDISGRLVLRDGVIEQMCRAHDEAEAAQRGEPSPWRGLDMVKAADAAWRHKRLAAMRAALTAAGFL